MLREETARVYEELLLQVIHIDCKLMNKPVEEFIKAIKNDKKQQNEFLTIVLMTDEARELKIVHDVNEEEVACAFEYFKKIYADN